MRKKRAKRPLDKRWARQSAAGKAAHRKGVAHEWTSEEARAAGLKGVAAKRAKAQW